LLLLLLLLLLPRQTQKALTKAALFHAVPCGLTAGYGKQPIEPGGKAPIEPGGDGSAPPNCGTPKFIEPGWLRAGASSDGMPP